ncbi:WD40-repeat-containing domain protein [Chaetomium tenue]|uniref:WD40-repeat-containing domain protein n=1 Tax=Chaetomium tenue TaxID=1854479 RepID=A0ACB7P6B4_9PEZI|nr:WD40-repeat-containing domain protein [Chaetomium globosum]
MATDGRPAQPKSILRGHKAQVHAAAFVRGNDRLLTGDADGFVVAWDITTMRPKAVWQAHGSAILGIAGWGNDRLITHGRDNKFIVWKFTAEEESGLSKKLPLDPTSETRPQPWILYMLEVNTMNFCSFSHCPVSPGSGAASPEILVAVPNTLASEAIDIFHLPSQARQHTVKLGEKNGMVMALSLFHLGQTLTLVAGYENGAATVAQLGDHGNWAVRYHAKCHSQPVLSLDVSPNRDYFLTSSADAIIAKHPLPAPSPTIQTPQPNTTPSIPPPPAREPNNPTTTTTPPKSLLTAALTTNPQSNPSPNTPPNPLSNEPHSQTPLKTNNTRHAGQQSLRIRSDGRVFATAGWDARVRVYSARTLAEVAVLKWHGVGCYAVAFATMAAAEGAEGEGGGGGGGGATDADEDAVVAMKGEGGGKVGSQQQQEQGKLGQQSKEVVVVPKLVDVTVREKRERLAREGHWLAAGSKDGKVSLWDVF